MRWLLSRVIHTWKLTCMHQQLASCANSWKMMTEHTKLIWRGDFRTCLKRPGKSPNTGCLAAALITQNSTIRRLVFLLWWWSWFVIGSCVVVCQNNQLKIIKILQKVICSSWYLNHGCQMWWSLSVTHQGRRWEPFETLASVSGGGSAAICGAEPRAARAPSVGCGPAAMESVWDVGQADRSVSVCPQSYAPSSQQGLCGSQVSVDKKENTQQHIINLFGCGHHLRSFSLYLTSFCLFKVLEDRLAQRCLLPGFCVYRAWGLPSCWRCTSYSPGVQLPTRALWLRKVQTNSHLQSGLEVSPTSILLKYFLGNS